MAEYSQAGLLTALLLFTALTLRDVYVGRSSPQQADVLSEHGTTVGTGTPRAAEHSVLRFQYWLMGNAVWFLKLASILLIISGQNVFAQLGVDTPRLWTWSQENKIFSCLMAFFLCNMMETHFLSTGAFEVSLDDVPIWSKLQSGYVPNIHEMLQILHPHLNGNQRVDSSFS